MWSFFLFLRRGKPFIYGSGIVPLPARNGNHFGFGKGTMEYTGKLNLNKDFKRIYGRGKSAAYPPLVVYSLKNRLGRNRIGITASKKIGNAVMRNRARRLIKEAYRLCQSEAPVGFDFVFVARTRTTHSKMDDVKKSMQQAFLRMKMIQTMQTPSGVSGSQKNL